MCTRYMYQAHTGIHLHRRPIVLPAADASACHSRRSYPKLQAAVSRLRGPVSNSPAQLHLTILNSTHHNPSRVDDHLVLNLESQVVWSFIPVIHEDLHACVAWGTSLKAPCLSSSQQTTVLVYYSQQLSSCLPTPYHRRTARPPPRLPPPARRLPITVRRNHKHKQTHRASLNPLLMVWPRTRSHRSHNHSPNHRQHNRHPHLLLLQHSHQPHPYHRALPHRDLAISAPSSSSLPPKACPLSNHAYHSSCSTSPTDIQPRSSVIRSTSAPIHTPLMRELNRLPLPAARLLCLAPGVMLQSAPMLSSSRLAHDWYTSSAAAVA